MKIAALGSLLGRVSPLAYVVAVLVAVVGWQYFAHSVTKARLADCQLDTIDARRSLDIARAEIDDLAAHVEHQNKRVKAYEKEVDARQRRLLQVQEELERNRNEARDDLMRLTAETGTSCEDGIDLIDEELDL